MRWIRNPFFKPEPGADPGSSLPPDPDPAATTTDDDVEAGSAGLARPSSSPLRRPHPGDTEPDPDAISLAGLQRPTNKMTFHQFFYIFIIDGIGAMILSGSINFAIAYGTYLPSLSLTNILN